MKSLSEKEMDERRSVAIRGTRAIEISDVQDLIEVASRAVKRMRWFELPFSLLLVLFFLSMSVTHGGPPAVVFAILFALALARRIYRYRRSADHLSELEERLSELTEKGAMLPGPSDGLD